MNYLADCWTRQRLDDFHPVVRANQNGREAIRRAYAVMPEETRIWATETTSTGRLPMLATSAFVVPVLSPEGCRAICERSDDYDWSVNDKEAPEHQIKEAVLDSVDPEFFALMQSVLIEGLSPWLMMVWGRLPSQISSLQLAHYNPSGPDQTAMHIDRDSQYTAVISLNPGEFEGGGTAIADGLIGDYVIPPLPVGHALVFDGRRVLHRGLPTIGNRKLLVLWSHQDNDNW